LGYAKDKMDPMRYHRGTTSRYQQSFLSVDDQISKNHYVREIDELCEEFINPRVDTSEKGQKETGRKAYHPSDMAKILVYGYFNGINSSRKLERECGRNIEMKWLTGGLVPDHKTISDFRRSNPDLIKGVFNYLIDRFRSQGLIKGKQVGVDGSKIKGNASKELNIDTIKSRLEGIEGQIEKYFKDMEAIDKAEDEIEELSKKKAEMEKEVAELALKKKFYQKDLAFLEERREKRISLTDEDAKVMQGRYGSYWGYNVQAAVDTEHHFITAIEVTNNQNDKGLLAPMVEASEQATGQKVEEVLADGGYYKINQLYQLEQQGTKCYVAVNKTGSQAKDQKHGIKFTYVNEEDYYYCGEGERLNFFRNKEVDGRPGKVYKGTACMACPKKNVCTTGEARTVHRNENQGWIDGFHAKMQSEEGKAKLVKRKCVAEHPFGTMKYCMGQIPILLRGKKKVQIEMHLHGIGYNLKRYFNIKAQREEQLREMRAAA
jgi:transposase